MENYRFLIIFYVMKICIQCNLEKNLIEFRGNRKKCESCYNKHRYQQIKERRKNDPLFNEQCKKYDVQRKRKKE